MRRDAPDDFDDNLPSLSARSRDDDDLAAAPGHRREPEHTRRAGPEAVYSRTTPVVKVKAPGSGALWALVLALSIALGGLGWWSFQQLNMMEQQLVATQESFARISEDAAGRLQAISGKVAAGETSATTDIESMKLQLKQLQTRLDEQTRQQEAALDQQTGLGKRLEQMAGQQTSAQQAASEQAQNQLKALATEVAALKASQADAQALDAQLKAVVGDVATLKKQGDLSGRVQQVEQDLLVLRSQVDNQAAQPTSSGPNLAEFDAFRGQTTRNLTTLHNQIQNLQQQINAKR